MMGIDSELQEKYLLWLCWFLGIDQTDELLRQLHQTQFIWVVPNDVNRAEDGRELRDSVLEDNRVPLRKRDLMSGPEASVLEVLAALAQRASYQTEVPISRWFWLFLEHLGLDEFVGADHPTLVVDELVSNWMTRNISPAGNGGLFPLRRPPEDQRTTEIWNQMSAYIMEDMEADGFFD